MKRIIPCVLTGLLMCLLCSGDADGRGFGGFRAGGFSAGGFRAGGFSAGGFSAGGLDRSFDYSGSRSFSGYSGWRGGAATSSYDRTWSGSHGGSISAEGTRGAAVGPRGGAVAGGSRDVTATGPEGRTYSSETQRGAAVGPYGRTVGGSSGYRTASGPRGTASAGWQTAFAGTRFPTDFGLSHYTTFGATGAAHSTSYWSGSYLNVRAGNVRTNFGYYNCFHPAWYTAHPGCWMAAGWAAGRAWQATTWPAVASLCSLPADPVDYDYGTSIVYQNNDVYVDGQDAGTAENYAQQAITLADQGQQAKATPEQAWSPLGVFALVQGEEKTSNNIFQLAVNKEGVIRGNYYDGLMDTTTPVYGSVDKKTQRAAWTIGKKKDRIFEAGIYNLTRSETPVLVHFGTDRTQQWLLVRVEQPKNGK
jgi:hypothetical protein